MQSFLVDEPTLIYKKYCNRSTFHKFEKIFINILANKIDSSLSLI